MIIPALVLAVVISGPVEATVTRVHDGDTIAVDTPELRGKCDAEKELARAARALLRERAGERITLTNVTREKYGRALADVTLGDGTSVAALMIEAGLARPYEGGRRAGWCAEAAR